MGEALDIRAVRPEERAAAARLIYEPPGPEMSGIAGSETLARRLGERLFETGAHPAPSLELHAAFEGATPVGVLAVEKTAGAGGETGVAGASVLPAVLATFRPWQIPGLAHRGWLRSRLSFPLPGRALHVVELHVAPHARNRGLGARLLRRAEAVAKERGCERLVLSTLMSNPARRLYEREGLAVTAERTVRGYERVTGSPGRVFMEKRLRSTRNGIEPGEDGAP